MAFCFMSSLIWRFLINGSYFMLGASGLSICARSRQVHHKSSALCDNHYNFPIVCDELHKLPGLCDDLYKFTVLLVIFCDTSPCEVLRMILFQANDEMGISIWAKKLTIPLLSYTITKLFN